MELGFLLDPLRVPIRSYRFSVELPVPLVLGRRPLRESRRRQRGRGRRERPPVPVAEDEDEYQHLGEFRTDLRWKG